MAKETGNEEELSKKEMIEWINNASYEDLLRKWRFGRLGDPFFQGAVGTHFTNTMKHKKKQADHVAVSKKVGW